MVATDLDGVRVKLALAQANAAELDALLAPVIDEATNEIERVPEEVPGEAVFRIRKVPWIDPTWRALFGQGINNIRSALDHLAWQLVLLDGGSPGERTMFPLVDSETDGRGRTRHVRVDPPIRSPEIAHAIGRMQPRENGGRWVDQLGVVGELARIDKHRLLLAVTTMLNQDDIFWGLPEGFTSPQWWFPVGEQLRDGSCVARFRFNPPVVPDGFDPHLKPQICLAEAPLGSPYRTQNIAKLLDGLAKITANRIDQEVVAVLFPDERPMWVLPQPRRDGA